MNVVNYRGSRVSTGGMRRSASRRGGDRESGGWCSRSFHAAPTGARSITRAAPREKKYVQLKRSPLCKAPEPKTGQRWVTRKKARLQKRTGDYKEKPRGCAVEHLRAIWISELCRTIILTLAPSLAAFERCPERWGKESADVTLGSGLRRGDTSPPVVWFNTGIDYYWQWKVCPPQQAAAQPGVEARPPGSPETPAKVKPL